MEINYNKEVWEGWTIGDFINSLEEPVKIFIANSNEFNIKVTKDDIKQFCKNNQPYYERVLPEVVEHFIRKYNIK